MATGFDTSFKDAFSMTGDNGMNFAESMQDDPKAYFGICNADMPNYFAFGDANAPFSRGGYFTILEITANNIFDSVKKIARENIRYVLL